MTREERTTATMQIINYFRELNRNWIEEYFGGLGEIPLGTNAISNCTRQDAQAIRKMVDRRLEKCHLIDSQCEIMRYDAATMTAWFDIN